MERHSEGVRCRRQCMVFHALVKADTSAAQSPHAGDGFHSRDRRFFRSKVFVHKSVNGGMTHEIDGMLTWVSSRVRCRSTRGHSSCSFDNLAPRRHISTGVDFVSSCMATRLDAGLIHARNDGMKHSACQRTFFRRQWSHAAAARRVCR